MPRWTRDLTHLFLKEDPKEEKQANMLKDFDRSNSTETNSSFSSTNSGKQQPKKGSSVLADYCSAHSGLYSHF
ncbi:hypothetical protein L596_027836 [Steinernema carpocapsae]|uniref:Uncharacterized protein n=1 Tax=Steinernema carpocapsae TaxID=34508 RepID=A0A4U5LWP9_STECR|nr:hypothetical protein L596_027836 [Steinernema carpocapsae]